MAALLALSRLSLRTCYALVLSCMMLACSAVRSDPLALLVPLPAPWRPAPGVGLSTLQPNGTGDPRKASNTQGYRRARCLKAFATRNLIGYQVDGNFHNCLLFKQLLN